MTMHLWEVRHPYYCNEANYFENGCTSTFASWQSFVDEEGDSDLDLNLVFRWDWEDAGNPDHEINQDVLKLFYVGQRKGLFRSAIIQVRKEDEPAIREWLLKRAAHMRLLWEPLIPSLLDAPPRDEPRTRPNTREGEEKTGRCESCGSEQVKVLPYRSGSGMLGNERNHWMCDICARTYLGNWTDYVTVYSEGRREIGKLIACAANRVLAAVDAAGGKDERDRLAHAFVADMRLLSDRAKKERVQ